MIVVMHPRHTFVLQHDPGRSGLHALEAVVSTLHLTMKFPTPGGIGVVRGHQRTSRNCYVTSCRGGEAKEVLPSDILDPRMNPIVLMPEGKEVVIAYHLIEGDPSRTIKIGSEIDPNLGTPSSPHSGRTQVFLPGQQQTSQASQGLSWSKS